MIVFISYARVDKHLVEPLASFLIEHGHEPWLDHLLLPGQDWKKTLLAQIGACQVFLYAISNYSVDSEWCRWEFGKATELQKQVLPVILKKKTRLPADLKHLHCVPISAQDRILGGLAIHSQSAPQRTLEYPEEPKGQPSRVAFDKHRSVNSPHLHLKNTSVPHVRRSYGKTTIKQNSRRTGPIIAIDFGTTNSLCAHCDVDVPKVIPNRLGKQSTPSAVYVESDGTILTGESANNATLQDPIHGVLQTKRLFGTGWELSAYGHSFSAAQLAGALLRDLRSDCETFLKRDCRKAVVTAPAYFGEPQLDDLRMACEFAEIDLVRIVAEPTAAAMAFGLGGDIKLRESMMGDIKLRESMIGVFDLGGGTFDISILELNDDHGMLVFEVIAIDGEAKLGGSDYDEALVEYCVKRFKHQTGVDLTNNVTARMRIRQAAEQVKIVLTSTKSAKIEVPFIFADASGALNLDVQVTRHEFNNLTGHLTGRIIDCCQNVLSRRSRFVKSVRPDLQIEELLMVGLATRTPQIREKAEDFFAVTANTRVDPDTAVVLGASIQAMVLEGKSKNILLLDVTSQDIGFQIFGDVMTVIVERDTTIPTEKKQIFTSTVDNQTTVILAIFEGSNERAADNICLSRFVFDQIQPAPAGTPQLEITFDIDQNNNLETTITDIGNGDSRTIPVTTNPVYEDKPETGVLGELTEIANDEEDKS